MIITFNKRELLEFPNWIINQKRLPPKFHINLKRGKDYSKLFKVLENLGMPSSKTDEMANVSIKEKTHLFISIMRIEDSKNIVDCFASKESVMIEGASKAQYGFLEYEEVEEMILFEHLPEFNILDYNLWLEHEKDHRPMSITMSK